MREVERETETSSKGSRRNPRRRIESSAPSSYTKNPCHGLSLLGHQFSISVSSLHRFYSNQDGENDPPLVGSQISRTMWESFQVFRQRRAVPEGLVEGLCWRGRE